MWQLGINIPGKDGLGTNKVEQAQHLVSVEQLIDMRPDNARELGENAYYLPLHLTLGLADVIVGFNHLLGLNEDGAPAGTLVMHDAFYLALVHGRDGDYQAPVAHAGSGVLIKIAVLAACVYHLAHEPVDARCGAGDGLSQLLQQWRGVVFDISILVEHSTYFGHDIRKRLHGSCKAREVGVGLLDITIAELEEMQNLTHGAQ